MTDLGDVEVHPSHIAQEHPVLAGRLTRGVGAGMEAMARRWRYCPVGRVSYPKAANHVAGYQQRCVVVQGWVQEEWRLTRDGAWAVVALRPEEVVVGYN